MQMTQHYPGWMAFQRSDAEDGFRGALANREIKTKSLGELGEIFGARQKKKRAIKTFSFGRTMMALRRERKISPANINAIIFIRFGYASPWSPKRFALRFIVCVITLHYQSDLHEFELVETTSGSIASFLSSFRLHSNGSRSGDGFSEWKSSSDNRVPPLDFPTNEWMAHWRLPTGKHKCSTKYHEFKLVIPTNKK